MSKSLRVDIEVKDKASKPIDGIKKSFDNLKKSTESSTKSIGGLKKSFEGIASSSKQFFSIAAVGFAAVAAGAVAFGAAMLAANKQQKELSKLNKQIGNEQAFQEMRRFAGEAGISIDKLIEQGGLLAKAYKRPQDSLKLFKSLADLQAKGILNEQSIGQATEALQELASKSRVGAADFEKFNKIFGKDFNVDLLSRVSGKTIPQLQKALKEGTLEAKYLAIGMTKISDLPPGDFAKKYALGDIESQITNIETTLASFRMNLFEALFGKGEEGARNLAEINKKLKDLTSVDSLTNAINFFKEYWGLFAPPVFVARHWKDIENIFISVKTTFTSTMKYIESLNERFMKMGSDIIDGLWNGIRDSWKTLIENVKGLTNLLPQTVKKILGIQSPSKVFKKIGNNMMEGLHIGIKAQSRPVVNLLDKLSKQSINTFANTGKAIASGFPLMRENPQYSDAFGAWDEGNRKMESDAAATINSASMTKKPDSVVPEKKQAPKIINNISIPIKIDVKPGGSVDKDVTMYLTDAITNTLTDILSKQNIG